MKKLICCLTFLSVSLLPRLSPSVIAAQEAKPEMAEKIQQFSSPLEAGVQLTLSMPEVFERGSKIPLKISIRNSGKSRAYLNVSEGELLLVKVDLKAKDGSTVPYTLFGKSYYQPDNKQDLLNKLFESSPARQLRAGATLDLSVNNLALVYDLTLPGEYVMTISRTVGVLFEEKAIKLEIGAVKFAVK